MGTRTVTLQSGAVIRIRPYCPDDRDQIIRVFSQGLLGLAPGGVGHIFRSSRPLQLCACATPAAALIAIPKHCSFLVKAIASLGAAAIVPCFVFGMLRRLIKRYVVESINGPDLSSIEAFYSTSGSGHGSAFWVAELVEQETLTIGAPLAGTQPPQASRLASAASFQTLTFSGNATNADQVLAPLERFTSPAAVQIVSAAPMLEEPALTPGPNTDRQVNADSMESKVLEGSHANMVSSSEAPQSADAEECRVREIVAGLVAAAVARLEGASSSSSSPSSLQPSALTAAAKAAPSTSAFKDAEKDAEAKQDKQGEPPTVAMPLALSLSVPDTPVVVVLRPPIGSSAELASAGSAAGQAPRAPALAVTETPTVAEAPLPNGGGGGSCCRPKIIGHVAVERKSWKLAELRHMGVLKQYSGQGVGKQLLETVVQHARDNGFRELNLHTLGMQPTARRLYARGGWSVSKVSQMQGIDVYTYTLDLTKKH